MVSRRDFLSTMLMMAVILFMCQFSQVIKENGSNYDVNPYIKAEGVASGAARWKPKDKPVAAEYVKYAPGTFVVYLGDTGTDVYGTVSEWCGYAKYELLTRGGTEGYSLNPKHLPRAIIVDSNTVDLVEGLDFFEGAAKYDVTIIFCNLPEPGVISGNERLMELLGIKEVWYEEVETEGAYLFSGLMLGGDSFYKLTEEEQEEELERERESKRKKQDLELNMPWYLITGGTKTYMVGITEEILKGREDMNEYFPAIIWRHNIGDCEIFCVNGDYMDDMTGLGILSGMMYESAPYVIYPVVNAQNVTLVNFPGFAGENDDKMEEVYSRNAESVLRDICWPSLVAVCNTNKYRPSCLMAAQYDYSDDISPSAKEVKFYFQQFKEYNAEAGLSLKCLKGDSLDKKLDEDEKFFNSLGMRYEYASAYMGEEELAKLRSETGKHDFLKTIKTVTGEFGRKEPIVSYYNDDMTLQNCVIESDFHSYADNMYLKSIETALGYANVYLDMYKVVWPESKEDEWEIMAEEVISNLNTYLKIYDDFEKTTLTESDAKVRTFLNLDYNTWRSGDDVRLDVKNGDGACFIFRTHGEKISGIAGARYTELEKDSYLIYADSPHVRITLEKYRGIPEYYIGNGD